MTDTAPRFTFGKRSRERLEGVHPDLVRVAELGLELSPYDFAVAEGKRTRARQAELVASGASMTMDSKHLEQADGWAHALDVVAVGDLDADGDVDAQDKARTWDPDVYTAINSAMQQAAAELGVKIRWGGTFKRRDGRPFFDGPHFEIVSESRK